MKLLLLISLIILPGFVFSGDIILNEYGHIVTTTDIREDQPDYYFEDNHYSIEYKDLTFWGNSFFQVSDGYLTLTTLEENVPTRIRFYDLKGNPRMEKEFRRVINITFSDNRKYAIFSTGDNCILLNLENAELEYYPGNSVFSIGNDGEPIIFIESEGKILYKNRRYLLSQTPGKIAFFQNTPLIFTADKLYCLGNKELKLIHNFSHTFFEAGIYNGKLYFVEKEIKADRFDFKLFSTSDLRFFQLMETSEFNRENSRIHTPIPAPLVYDEINYPYNVGNSYAEIQLYGWSPYLHPGVDFLGEDYQEVYAVHDGFVKAVLTTGGSPYWRVAIANEDVSTEIEGYLYAHLNEDSIVHTVGDSISAGDFLGTLYPWSVYDFTHIHFARLLDSGSTWNGDWWTIDNPLIDVYNIIDITPPVFENSIDDDLFAFRDLYGNYLDGQLLTGQFDIITKCHDICNSTWKIDVWDLEYSLHPLAEPDSTIFQKFAFAFDMPLDTYISGNFDNMVLNTIYSQDETCYSLGNYETRDFFHIITNSDGDSVFTENDALQYFDSSQFADGDYLFRVTVRDAMLNATSAEMQVTFINGVGWHEDELILNPINLEQNYPNPFNPQTSINYSLTEECNVGLKIYNLRGQVVKVLVNQKQNAGNYNILWNANMHPSGIYIYRIKTPLGEISRKMILAK